MCTDEEIEKMLDDMNRAYLTSPTTVVGVGMVKFHRDIDEIAGIIARMYLADRRKIKARLELFTMEFKVPLPTAVIHILEGMESRKRNQSLFSRLKDALKYALSTIRR